MRAASSVDFCTVVSRTRMPGFEKLTFAPGAKFFPLILRPIRLPGVTLEGSTEATSGLPRRDAETSSVAAAVPLAALPCGPACGTEPACGAGLADAPPPMIVNVAWATEPSGP